MNHSTKSLGILLFCLSSFFHLHGQQDPTWDALVNASVESGTNALISDAATWQDVSHAYSQEELAENVDGWVEVTVSQVNAEIRFGFSTPAQKDGNWDIISHQFVIKNNGAVSIRAGSSYVTTLQATAQIGHVYRVSRQGGDVKYYRNDTLQYTVLGSHTDAMVFDVGLKKNAEIRDAQISFGGSTQDPGNFVNTLNRPTWQNEQRTEYVEQTNVLKSTATSWGDFAGAHTREVLPAGEDGSIAFTLSQTGYNIHFGFSTVAGKDEMYEFAHYFKIKPDNRVTIQENGSWRKTLPDATVGTTYKITRESGVIKFFRGSTLEYTSSQSAQGELVLDVGMYVVGAEIADAALSFGPPAVSSVVGDSVMLYWKEESGTTGYDIYRSQNPTGGFELITSVSSTATNYLDLVTGGNTYYYKVVPSTKSFNAVDNTKAETWLVTPAEDVPDVTIQAVMDWYEVVELKARGFGEIYWFLDDLTFPVHVGDYFKVDQDIFDQTDVITLRSKIDGKFRDPVSIKVDYLVNQSSPLTLTSCTNEIETAINTLLTGIQAQGDLSIRQQADLLGCDETFGEQSLNVFTKKVVMNKLCNNIGYNRDCFDPQRENNYLTISDNRRIGEDSTAFRIIWGASESNYTYYSACPPAGDEEMDNFGNYKLLKPTRDFNYDGGLGTCNSNHSFKLKFYRIEAGDTLVFKKEDIAYISPFYFIDSSEYYPLSEDSDYDRLTFPNLIATDLTLTDSSTVRALVHHNYANVYLKWKAKTASASLSVEPTTIPPPKDFFVEGASQTSIRLSWNTDNYGTYKLEKSLDSTSFSLLIATDQGVYLDESLSPDTKYYYRLKLESDSYTTDYTSIVSGFTLSAPDSTLSHVPQKNGNISAMTWKNFQDAKINAYAFHYDKLDRLKAAEYSNVELSSPQQWTSTSNKGAYTVNEIQYDRNGNIEFLKRQNGDLELKLIDELVYTYQGNQLMDVRDYGTGEGFKDGHQGTDYAYDANGNLTKDLNKGIALITYNHLNLPEYIEGPDGKWIDFYYDAAGNKLRKVAKDERLVQTDYEEEYIYEVIDNEKTLVQIMHEEGRIVQDITTGNWDYQYHLKDHLGNVRTTFSTQPKTIEFTINYENSDDIPDDGQLFEEVHTLISNYIYNHTEPDSLASYAQRLNGDEGSRVGSILTLPVGKGDKVSAKVFAKYESVSGDPTVVSTPLSAMLISALTGQSDLITEFGTSSINDAFTTTEGGIIGTSAFAPQDPNGVKAFLNVLFISDQGTTAIDSSRFAYDQISGGEQIVGSQTNSPHDSLSVTNFEAPSNGIVIIYLSNEGADQRNVYFDDLSVTLNEHPIVQTDDYYPFGLTYSSYQRFTVYKNTFNTFQDQEKLYDLDLEWLQFKWRNHQPDIGRFFNIDPISEDYYYNSPYAFSENKLISYRELEGLEAVLNIGQENIMNGGQGGIVDVETITDVQDFHKEMYNLQGVSDDAIVNVVLDKGGNFKNYEIVDSGAAEIEPDYSFSEEATRRLNNFGEGVEEFVAPKINSIRDGLISTELGVEGAIGTESAYISGNVKSTSTTPENARYSLSLSGVFNLTNRSIQELGTFKASGQGYFQMNFSKSNGLTNIGKINFGPVQIRGNQSSLRIGVGFAPRSGVHGEIGVGARSNIYDLSTDTFRRGN